jgi:DNA-binding HxlR family transcriptional regulator
VNAEKTKAGVAKILAAGSNAASSGGALRYLEAMVDSMLRDGTHRDGPLREIPARLGDKWSMLILLLLRAGKFRHSELQKLIVLLSAEGSISQRMLTLRLRALERDGLLRRQLLATQPPGVEYALSEMGAGLMQQIDSLMDWIRSNRSAIDRCRAQYEAVEGKLPEEKDAE